ncbi:MAG: PID-CTERM protein-sorting domain-containing protein [Bacteroidota bacterium]
MLILAFTFVLLFTTEVAVAQPGLPGPPSQVPIDGGIIELLVMGSIYTIYKFYSRSDNADNN